MKSTLCRTLELHAFAIPGALVRVLGAGLSLAIVACEDSDVDVDSGQDARTDVGPKDSDVVADVGFDGGDSGDSGDPAPMDAGLQDNWSCLPLAGWHAPTLMSAVVNLSFASSEDAAGNAIPAEGVRVEVCPAALDCSDRTFTATTGADGGAELTVPTPAGGFRGHFSVSGPDVIPTRLHLLPPIWRNGTRWSGPWFAPTWAFLTRTATAGGGPTLDHAKGHAVILAADCGYDSDLPERSDTDETMITANGRTADVQTGYAHLFWNLDPGEVVFEAKLGQAVVGRVTRTISAGTFTEGVLGPTPLD
ncbi:MAG: hypothetical protein HYV07_28035 [Deltaproteobacteria bacterium]|nr:hypothetical protein [Deltaproteobacteria bacterium]